MSSDQRGIVHLAYDEKFIDMAMREFEAAAPGLHRLVIIGQPRPLKHVKSKAMEFRDFRGMVELVKSDECSAVVFHSLPDPALLEHIPPGKIVIWLGWGFDYYDRLLSGAFPGGLWMPKTKALMQAKPTDRRAQLMQMVKQLAKRMLGRSAVGRTESLARVDYFSPVLDVEHRMACDLNPWFKPKLVTWNYGTAEDDYGASSGELQPLGGNIMVGNSATADNNHIEVFELLEACPDLQGRKIVVPLSYGDDWYKQEVIRVGRAKFGEQFMPLTDFMKADDYVTLLQSCGHVFMNHFRQQAFGNICIVMLKGARVYMNSISPLYQWLSARGASIQAIDDMGAAIARDDFVFKPLSMQEQSSNVNAIVSHFGREVQRAKTKQLVDIALGVGH